MFYFYLGAFGFVMLKLTITLVSLQMVKSRSNFLNVSSRILDKLRQLMFLSCHVPINKVLHEQSVAINSASINFLHAEVAIFLK
jgi:hypothetical protein